MKQPKELINGRAPSSKKESFSEQIDETEQELAIASWKNKEKGKQYVKNKKISGPAQNNKTSQGQED